MNPTKDYTKVVVEQEAKLLRLKQEFDRQSAELDALLAQAETLGLVPAERPDASALSEEERRYCFEFERQLNEINHLLAPEREAQVKAPRLGRRQMI